MRRIFNKLVDWFQPNYATIFVEDFPENIEQQNIYVVGSKEYPWQVAFKCPCGCASIIQLSLLAESRPNWKFKIDKFRRISLNPSIWRKIGCKSHFFIRKGKVLWVKEY